MPVPFQKDCLHLLLEITRELGAIRGFVRAKQQWPVGSLEDLVEMLTILRGTDLDASKKYGYVTPEGEGQRFVCYEEAIEGMRKGPEGQDIESPLDELQTLVETELYSKGSGWPALEEKRVETVSRANAEETLGEFDSFWRYTVDALIRWYDINPHLEYRRPYRQAVR